MLYRVLLQMISEIKNLKTLVLFIRFFFGIDEDLKMLNELPIAYKICFATAINC